ncbi:MAG: DUF2007 domain-containing protein [Candidatus Omnitrophota bacterium]|jgi:hypothetical protein
MTKSKFVIVLTTNDHTSMAMAKSLLQSAGIEYYVKGEILEEPEK